MLLRISFYRTGSVLDDFLISIEPMNRVSLTSKNIWPGMAFSGRNFLQGFCTNVNWLLSRDSFQ